MSWVKLTCFTSRKNSTYKDLRQIGSGPCPLLDSWRKHYYFIYFLNVSSEMQKQYYGLKRLNKKNSNKMICSQTFIKRSPYKTGDLLKEVQFK